MYLSWAIFGLATVSIGALIPSSSIPANSNANSHIIRRGSSLFLNEEHWTASGANVYWLGLDENVVPPAGQPFYAPTNASYPTLGRITEVMNTLVTMGATLIRGHTLGISVGNPLSMMPALDTFNEAAFETIDWSVFVAGQKGLKIMVPLIDNYDYYHGGKFDFLRFRDININSSAKPLDPLVMEFYTNEIIISDFKNYIHHLLTHKNQFNGLTYAEDPTIFAYETGNELGGPVFGDRYVPVSWITEIAKYVKELAPDKLVIDGTYGINTTHLAIDEVDILSDHFYPLNNTKLKEDISLVEAADKVYLAGEIDWTGLYGGDSLQSFYDIVEAQQKLEKPVIAGDVFWSLFMHDVPNCQIFVNHSDGFTLQYNNPLNDESVNGQISIVRKHYFAMQNVAVNLDLPPVACPGTS